MIDYGDTLIAGDDRLERTSKLGVDEHTFQHANAQRRTQMATTFVDIDRGRLLDVVPGRSGQVVREWVGLAADLVGRPDRRRGDRRVPWLRHRDRRRAPRRDAGDRSLPRHPPRLRSRSTTSVAGCSKTPSVIAAASLIRSTGSAGCCCARGPTSTSEAGNGSAPGSPPATPTARSPPCGWPASCSPRSTPPATSPTPGGG